MPKKGKKKKQDAEGEEGESGKPSDSVAPTDGETPDNPPPAEGTEASPAGEVKEPSDVAAPVDGTGAGEGEGEGQVAEEEEPAPPPINIPANLVSKAGEMDVAFIVKLDEKYLCLSCKQVIRFPMQLKECGHRVCAQCVAKFLEYDYFLWCQTVVLMKLSLV